jgi:osmotically-inducible protein OsmY
MGVSGLTNNIVEVAKGWITLAGHIALDFQKDEAGALVSALMGVSGLTNNIVVERNYRPANIQMTIEEALRHSLEWKSDRIRVTVAGGHVTLSGHVQSYSESQNARRVAWNAPGVLMVENNLQVA